MKNIAFWHRFWTLWSEHESRFQGQGIQFTGKAANWRQACHSFLTIVDAGQNGAEADPIVSQEIDRLAELGNPMRGAWLSEMLCHFFPRLYPVKNGPVNRWLTYNKWRGRRGTTEGQRYVELSQQLRRALDAKPAGARDLAELDLAIWKWANLRE